MEIERDLIENCHQFQVGSMTIDNIKKSILDSFDRYQKGLDGDLESIVDLTKLHVHKYFDRWNFSTDKLKEFCKEIDVKFYQDPMTRNYIFSWDRESNVDHGYSSWSERLKSVLMQSYKNKLWFT